MSSIFTGARNFTWMRVPPAKSIPCLGPPCTTREIMLTTIIAIDPIKAIFLLLIKFILTSDFINCIDFPFKFYFLFLLIFLF